MKKIINLILALFIMFVFTNNVKALNEYCYGLDLGVCETDSNCEVSKSNTCAPKGSSNTNNGGSNTKTCADFGQNECSGVLGGSCYWSGSSCTEKPNTGSNSKTCGDFGQNECNGVLGGSCYWSGTACIKKSNQGNTGTGNGNTGNGNTGNGNTGNGNTGNGNTGNGDTPPSLDTSPGDIEINNAKEIGTVGEGFCKETSVKRTLKTIGFVLLVIKIVLPLIISGKGIFDLYKVVMDGKSETFGKNVKTLAIRIVIGLAIFFVPNIIHAFIGELLPDEYKECEGCVLAPTNECVVQKSGTGEIEQTSCEGYNHDISKCSSHSDKNGNKCAVDRNQKCVAKVYCSSLSPNTCSSYSDYGTGKKCGLNPNTGKCESK